MGHTQPPYLSSPFPTGTAKHHHYHRRIRYKYMYTLFHALELSCALQSLAAINPGVKTELNIWLNTASLSKEALKVLQKSGATVLMQKNPVRVSTHISSKPMAVWDWSVIKTE